MSEKDNLELFKDKADNSEYINKLLPDVFVSNGDIQKFNAKDILDSIRRETHLPVQDAKKVTELVVRRIIASGIKFLSGPHIRELVCSALSEMNYEEERKRFTRIGMPINDYEELLQSKYNERAGEYTAPENIHRWAAGQLASEYALLKLLSEDQTRSHLSGDIHIHSLRYFDMRPFAQNWDLRMILQYGLPPSGFHNSTMAKPAKQASTAVLHASRWLSFAHSEFSGEQCYPYFNTFIAPYLKGKSYSEIKQMAQMFIFETNQSYISKGSHIPINSIVTTPKIPDVLRNVDAIAPGGVEAGKYKNYENEAAKFFNAICEVYTEGDANGKFFAFPKHKILIDKATCNDLSDNVLEEVKKMGTPIFLNGSAPWIGPKGWLGPFHTNEGLSDYLTLIGKPSLFDWSKNVVNFGALQSISLNLPRIAYEASGNDNKIEEIIVDRMGIVKNILLKKKSIIQELLDTKRLLLCSRKIDERNILDLDCQALVFGFIGLNEMVKSYTGKYLHEGNEALSFGKRVLNIMKNQCTKYTREEKAFFTLWDQPAEFSTHRFAQLDHTHHDNAATKVVNGNLNKQSFYYTTSAHSLYSANTSLETRKNVHSNVGQIIQNNNIMYLWLKSSGENCENDVYKQNICNLVDSSIAEFSFTHDFTLCQKCGSFRKGFFDSCENCRNDLYIKKFSRVTDYYTPLELCNSGKKQEIYDRHRISL